MKHINGIQGVALYDIVLERKAQDEKWGSQREVSFKDWISILGEEFGELCTEVLMTSEDETSIPENLYQEACQVAAVALNIMESYLCRIEPGFPFTVNEDDVL